MTLDLLAEKLRPLAMELMALPDHEMPVQTVMAKTVLMALMGAIDPQYDEVTQEVKDTVLKGLCLHAGVLAYTFDQHREDT